MYGSSQLICSRVSILISICSRVSILLKCAAEIFTIEVTLDHTQGDTYAAKSIRNTTYYN